MKANEVTPPTPRAPACWHQGGPSQAELPLNIFPSPEGQQHGRDLPARASREGPVDPHVTTEQAEGQGESRSTSLWQSLSHSPERTGIGVLSSLQLQSLPSSSAFSVY